MNNTKRILSLVVLCAGALLSNSACQAGPIAGMIGYLGTKVIAYSGVAVVAVTYTPAIIVSMSTSTALAFVGLGAAATTVTATATAAVAGTFAAIETAATAVGGVLLFAPTP